MLSITTIPAIRIVRAHYRVHELCSGSKSLDVSAADTSLRVWRKDDFQVLHAPIDARESVALQKLVSGEPFAAMCEAFADLAELRAVQEATGLLARWIEDRIISRIDLAA